MPEVKRKYPKEVFAERGDAIFEKHIRPHLKPEDDGKFVAIDIETGEYEIADDELLAGDRLHERVPGAQIWMVRVGWPYVHRFGGHARETPMITHGSELSGMTNGQCD